MSSHTLYLCYFGLREPLVQTQVLPYLREIAKLENFKVSLLTFEPDLKQNWTIEESEAEQKRLAQENISWYFLPYHKQPSAPATAYDILNGARFAVKLSRKQRIDFLHARAHIPMLMALLASKITKSQIVFDIRGLMAEEYSDAGIWSEQSKLFRLIKRIERTGIKNAARVVVLTERMRDYLVENRFKEKKDIEVIPCCVDFSRVENSTKHIEKSERFELIYAGSVTGLYLLKEMGMFFLELKKHKKDAYFRILTASSPEYVHQTFRELGINENDYAVAKVSPAEVPERLKQAHLGVSFRKPTFSQIAASPTKIPEYLACGLPVISNYGIGDTDFILENENVGVCLKDFNQSEMARGAEKVLAFLNENGIKEKCAKVALKYFDLSTVGRNRYQNVYRHLMAAQQTR